MNTLIREKTRRLILAILLMLSPVFLIAQIQYGGQPLAKEIAFAKEQSTAFRKTIALNDGQLATRHQILTEETPSGQAMRAGFSITVNYDPTRDGVWENIGDTLWVWRLKINAEQANAVGLVFENFTLAANARLFIYNENASYHIGAFTHQNNNALQLLSAQMIPGETLIIEYQETRNPESGEKFTNSYFQISELIYVVNGLAQTGDKNLGSSDECMININCSEGDKWQRQKRGIARMLMRVGNSWYWCSGTLINNTLHDGTPYFLFADHCGFNASAEDMSLWQYYFNFERPGCDDIGAPVNNVLYGSTLIANAPLDGGSDFKLVLLHQRPPLFWRPYYNGWNNMDIPSDSGVGIHHPAGDAKKISTYMGGVISGGGSFNTGEEMAENSAWRFAFVATENGHSVTQGGSSGSPMFNKDGLVVGTLSGGSSSCSSPSGSNIYGKIAYHWDSNHDHPAHQLEPHLDPIGTGMFFVKGYDPYIENYPAPGFVSAELVNNDTQVALQWLKPGHAPNNPGWYGYTSSYTGTNNATPERATVFDAVALGYSYPVTVSKISHIFKEKSSDPWQNDQFSFRIYGSNGMDLLYSSPALTAVSLEEVIHELDPPLTFEDKFYVSVRPAHTSGHPSSAYNITNEGNSFSYTGHATDWQVVGDNAHQYVFLTKVYIEKDSQYPPPPEEEKMDGNLSDESELQQAKIRDERFTIANKWSDLPISYNIYKNGENIHTLDYEAGIELFYLDDIADETGDYIRYHITAVYEGAQSAPSTSTYVFLNEHCTNQVAEFPYEENFDSTELTECWSTEGTAGEGWAVSQGYTVLEEIEVSPFEGDNFMYVQAMEEENQDEWLLSPTFDVSNLEVPALKFHFNGHYASANEDNESQLNVYVSFYNNSFVKIWDSSESPLFRNFTSNTWIPAVINLTNYIEEGSVRIGFQYLGSAGENFGIDKVEIMDASEMVYNLTLGHLPLNSGEVYGAGSYIEGEKVEITAYANTSYFFNYWAASSQMLTWLPDYRFTMPGENRHITANFTLENVTSTDDIVADEELVVYPNPSRGHISLKSSAYKENLSIEVFNTAGVMVTKVHLEYLDAGQVYGLDLSGQPQGLYFMVVSSEEEREVRKINLLR